MKNAKTPKFKPTFVNSVKRPAKVKVKDSIEDAVNIAHDVISIID